MSSDSDRIQSQKKHCQYGERGTVSVPGQVGNIRGYHTQDQPAGPFTWNFRLESSKLTELEVERMREVVRPWLVITKTETVGYTGQAVFTLTALTLGSLATGTIFYPLCYPWPRPVYHIPPIRAQYID